MKYNLQEVAREARALLLQGEITYKDAIDILEPAVLEANIRARELAKKFGRRHRDFEAASFLR